MNSEQGNGKKRRSKRKYLIDMKFRARSFMFVCLFGKTISQAVCARKIGNEFISSTPYCVQVRAGVCVCLCVYACFFSFFSVALRPSIM